jgi:UPF0755 protein
MRKVFFSLGGVLLVLFTVAAAGVFTVNFWVKKPLELSSPMDFTVEKGASLAGVVNQLSARGVIDSPRALSLYGRFAGYARKLQAGEYRLEPGMTGLALLEKFIRGDVQQHPVTLIEGQTFFEYTRALMDTPKLTSVLSGLAANQIMEKLGYPGEHYDGRFYPDTYYFQKGDTDLDILNRAYARMREVLSAEWKNRAPGLPYNTPYEALIMASLIEKETGLASERPQIAGVFARRLEKGMRLQTDPAVIYGLGAHYTGNLTRDDLQKKSPYNTYRVLGLPPTPIANPGIDAIRAALHPTPGNTLYFVARGNGSHHFSATLAAHQKAVRKYQLQHNNNYRSSP